MNRHQRIDAISNSHAGNAFENIALEYFSSIEIPLQKRFPLEIGFTQKKIHNFDLGCISKKIVVECKSHRWTKTNRTPSAKLSKWNEAMMYFHLAPKDYVKIFFVLHHTRREKRTSLLDYYRDKHRHMIPNGVIFVEWDEVEKKPISCIKSLIQNV